MAMTLKQLQQQLSGLEPYQEQSADALSEKARGLYKTQYESDLKALRDATEQGVLDINRSALDKGMQRSSYNQAQQGLMRAKGLESQQQLSTQYESNVANALNQLIENEYAKKTDADKYRNQLLMALYEYGRKGSGTGKTTPDPNNPKGDGSLDVNNINGNLNGNEEMEKAMNKANASAAALDNVLNAMLNRMRADANIAKGTSTIPYRMASEKTTSEINNWLKNR